MIGAPPAALQDTAGVKWQTKVVPEKTGAQPGRPDADARRLASLPATGQLDVAVLGQADAGDMRAGSGPMARSGS